MNAIWPFVATLACTLFTGAAVYINLVEHPARLSCATSCAHSQWAPSYQRATVMQASLALIAAAAAVGSWLETERAAWLAAGLLILAVVPFTLLVIKPTNNRLLEPARDPASAETRALLERWGRLHAVRSILSFAASLTMLYGLARG